MRTFDPGQQLEFLSKQARNLAPNLYRDYAFYLQELRSILVSSVKQAIFLLITDRDQNLIYKLSSEEVREFHLRIDELVSGCCSLLTVEQLMELVHKMAREKDLQREKARKELLNALNNEKDVDQGSLESIELSLASPLENPEQYESLISSLDDESGPHMANEALNESRDLNDDLSLANDSLGVSSEKDLIGQSNSSDDRKSDLDVMRTLFVMAGDSMLSDDLTLETHENSMTEELPQPNNISEDQRGLLPENPLGLAEWMDSLENALKRRLRNLSHALNVELLQAGVVKTLLPKSLLDAALLGQIDSKFAPSNLLRLSIPLQDSMFGGGMEALCVLLRLSDLEFENPRLRRCGSDLHHHRGRLHKMVMQQRHWQGRTMVQEAQRQWSQNPPESPQEPTSKN